MTRLERRQADLDKLYEYRDAALKANDLYWLHKNQAKIVELEKEVRELKLYGTKETRYLRDVLDKFSEEDKNTIYKDLLRINLLCDVVNEVAEMAKSDMRKVGILDFSFSKKIEDMCKLSQEIASILILPNNQILDDFIINDSECVDRCVEIANKYIDTKILV